MAARRPRIEHQGGVTAPHTPHLTNVGVIGVGIIGKPIADAGIATVTTIHRL